MGYQPIVGDVATFTVTFRRNGIPTDPGGVVSMVIKPPTGANIVIPQGSLTHVGPGVYSYDQVLNLPDEWIARGVAGQGAGMAAAEYSQWVSPSRVVT